MKCCQSSTWNAQDHSCWFIVLWMSHQSQHVVLANSFCQTIHLLFNTANLNRVLFHLQLMSHRTLSLALHCSMSPWLYYLNYQVFLGRWQTDLLLSWSFFFLLSNLYSILQSSSNKFQEWKFFSKFIQNYSRYKYILAVSLFSEAEFSFLISIGKLSIKVKWKKIWKVCFAFQSAHEEKYIGYFFQFIRILSSLKQGFNSSSIAFFLSWTGNV